MIKIKVKKTLKTRTRAIFTDIDFEIDESDFTALYGASGAGKTTILRLISGLLKPDSGMIEIGNETWFNSEKKINIPIQKRNVGFVFQDYALFPNMTVRENILYAIDGNKNEINDWIKATELLEVQNQKPDTLSAGQKQRAALVRALVRKPRILLLDEPLSALDIEMRMKLQEYILKVHDQFNLTTILVSHDISEVYKMAKKIFYLENGTIKTKGTPEEIFSKYHVNQVYS
jgi:molybdate transport system ATP-binding protein